MLLALLTKSEAPIEDLCSFHNSESDCHSESENYQSTGDCEDQAWDRGEKNTMVWLETQPVVVGMCYGKTMLSI